MKAQTRVHGRPAAIVYLLRHGETANDGVKRYVGQTDLALSHRGRKQAEAWGRYFLKVPLRAIVSSDLKRGRESAAIIAGHRPIPLKIKTGLREISMGSWENLAQTELQEHSRGEFLKRGAAIDSHRPPGGESFLDLQQRAVASLYATLAETADADEIEEGVTEGAANGVNDGVTTDLTGGAIENLAIEGHESRPSPVDGAGHFLIVGHAGLNRVLLCHFLGMPLVNLFRLGQEFACLNTMVQGPSGFRVLGINATLPDMP